MRGPLIWTSLLCAIAAYKVTLSVFDNIETEEDAKKALGGHLEDLKSIDPVVVENVVLHQWWDLARDIVARSHKQSVDFSFVVRKAVRTLKDEADELLRSLNPKYGQAQQVSPAFQWAQNDTCVFLTVKFTVRWNAPGALEVSDPSVNISDATFNFTGHGKHSNNKYFYSLSLELFDRISSTHSQWSAASVGKLSVTLRKKWPRKWPRLLGNKKTKIGNMHLWMEKQDQLDSTLSGMATASNSPVTCAASDKLYCLATDTCKKGGDCSQCQGKTTADEANHVCAGMPTEKASLNFKDADMFEHTIGGDVTISKARNEFDIDIYGIYWGKDDKQKLDVPEGFDAYVGGAEPSGSDTVYHMKHGQKIPEQATHLLVFSKNAYGEYASPGSVLVKDAVLPRDKASGVSFEDEDGDPDEVSGTVSIGKAADEALIDDYAVHWGKSPTKKIASSSSLGEVSKKDGREPSYYIARSTKVPATATHILVFTKNEHGEMEKGVGVKLVDRTKPCLADDHLSCATGVTATVDADPQKDKVQTTITVSRAPQEGNLTHYALYWGRGACAQSDKQGIKNGHIKDLALDSNMVEDVPADTMLPEGTTHVLVFPKNKLGESEHCKDSSFQDFVVNAEL